MDRSSLGAKPRDTASSVLCLLADGCASVLLGVPLKGLLAENASEIADCTL